MRWNGRRLPKLWSTEAWLRRHSFESQNWINRRMHCFDFIWSAALSHHSVSRLAIQTHTHSNTSINCWQNLPETQTHRNAENFLENYFVIVYNASPVVTNSDTCSMFVFISLNVMCPTKANDVNGYTYYKTYVCRALSIACTHNHPFAEVAAPTMPT